MPENNQASDATKPEATDSSSTQPGSQAVDMNHTNAIVPHQISNHDKLVQTMVMVDGEWVNVNDTNDQKNVQEDMRKVNRVVTEAQKDIINAQNAADSAAKSADSAISASKVNSDAIVAQNGAITDAQRTANSALEDAKNAMKNVSSEAASIRNDVKQAQDSISSTKTDLKKEFSDATADLQVQVNKNSAAILKNSEAIEIQERTASDAIADLKVADGQIKTIASDAQSNAAAAVQTASAATVMVSNAASDIAQIKLTASEAAFNATDAKSQAAQARATADSFSTRISSVESDTDKRLTANTSSIEQMKDTIALKADQSTVDDVKKDVSNVSAELRVQAGQISSKAESKDIDELAKKVNGNSTAIDQNAKMISAKANQTDVDTLNGSVTNNTSRLDLLGQEIKMKVDSSTVNNLIDSKGFITQKMTQTLIDQKADTINESITDLSRTVNGNNTTVMDKIQSITASVDGIQSTVANKADKSQITQLSNVIQSKVNSSDYNSKVSQLSTDINARVTKGDLLSQINIEAGRMLIQSNKIYLDADSVVFGKNSKAFIPAALITNLTADQITTGTLKSIQIDNGNGSFTVTPDGDVVANSIKLRNGQFLQGTIAGSTIYALNNDGAQDPKLAPKSDWYKITPNAIRWFNHYDQSVGQIGVGQGVLVNSGGPSEFTGTPGLTISDSAKILLGTAQRTVVTGDEIGNLETTDLDWMSRTNLEIRVDRLQVNLDPDQGNGYDGKGAEFDIQKDNKIGAYFGRGDHGNVIQLVTSGDGGNVDVNSSLTVHGAKNAVVPTSQGTVAINAYETAEYYFGDIGEDQTNGDGKVWVSIDYLFGQTVNTSVPYQVFVTPYSSAHVWVSKRLKNRFLVESDKPSASFAWEIKAKRKGYEHTRLKNVDNMMEKPVGVK